MKKVETDKMREFVESVAGYAVVFGLTQYDLHVVSMNTDGYHAMLESDSDNCTAILYYNPKVDNDPQGTALHECLHLLFARYRDLARYRFVDEKSLDAAEESIVRVLSKVMSNHGI